MPGSRKSHGGIFTLSQPFDTVLQRQSQTTNSPSTILQYPPKFGIRVQADNIMLKTLCRLNRSKGAWFWEALTKQTYNNSLISLSQHKVRSFCASAFANWLDKTTASGGGPNIGGNIALE